ncbi:MAG: hypothetical protein GX094_02835 [Clostridiales bacterium]|nr:hypothetical protein [Clostridiales bacterium]
MKIIAVQRGLEQIMSNLEKLGYKTLYYDEINSPIDALIYYQEAEADTLVNLNRLLSQQFETHPYQKPFGAILINARGKSTEDIVNIIENRLYEPLF